MHLRDLTTAALITALAASCADAATLTCQNRSVYVVARLGPPYSDSDSARAEDFGLFDRNANAYMFVSYPLYTAAEGRASQRSEIAGSAIHALCTADASIHTITPISVPPGDVSGVSQLEVCFRLHAASTVTIVAVSTATTTYGSAAPASASFVLSGPGGLLLELQRNCGSAGCPDSTLAATMPIPAGDYTVLASVRAEVLGPPYPGVPAESGITLDVSVSLDEPLVGVTPGTWTDAKRIYRRRPRPKARAPRAKSSRSSAAMPRPTGASA